MATSQQKTVQYGIFQKVLTTINSLQNNMAIAEESITQLLHNSFFLLLILMTAIGSRPKPELCFLPGRLR